MHSKNKSILKFSLVIILTIFSTSFATYFLFTKNAQKKINTGLTCYLKEVKQIERQIITNIPIYDDFKKKNPQQIAQCRRYLFSAHYQVALKSGVSLIHSEKELTEKIKKKELVYLDTKKNDFYFYNVSQKHRYLSPKAATALKLLSAKIAQKLKEYQIEEEIIVKYAISSAVRPMDYQKKLSKKNANAVALSTHSYACSFDIFYNDYYISLPVDQSYTKSQQQSIEICRPKLGFLLGDSLSQQLHTVLVQALLELQAEKILYITYEPGQSCYHLTVL